MSQPDRLAVATLLVIVALITSACTLSTQHVSRPGPSLVHTTGQSTTPSSMVFPGLPTEGAKPSEPVTGTLALSYLGPDGNGSWMDLSVYTDGRMIWQRWSPSKWRPSAQPLVIPDGATAFGTAYVWQRLTPDGVHRLRAAMLASGLFDHNEFFLLRVSYQMQVRTGGRTVWLQADTDGNRRPTRAQLVALRDIRTQMGDPSSWLPRSDWADATIHAFVPACYWVANERGGVDPAKMRPPASAELGKHIGLLRHAYEVMTTDDARALLQALIETGYPPSHETASEIGFMLPAATAAVRLGYLHIHPALPDRTGCDGVG